MPANEPSKAEICTPAAMRGTTLRIPRVLIVDDNPLNRRVAACICDMLGFPFHEAEDGLEAVETVRHAACDVILMDIRMPRMDGLEATRAIRALGASFGQLPIIAVTADTDPSDVARYRQAGMFAVVPKPVRVQRLVDEMRRALATGPEEPRSFTQRL